MNEDQASHIASWFSLGLKLRERSAAWLSSACLGIYFASSMSRDLSLYDSGELALAAFQPGLGHPPGQPLHTLLGWVARHMTFGAPLVGINLLSALPAALTVIPAASIVETLAGTRTRTRRSAAWSFALIALFAVHESLWEPATRVEVYALATLFAVWAIACLLPSFVERSTPQLTAAATFRAGIALGLSASANPVIALAVALGLAPGLLQVAVVQRQLPTLIGRALLGGFLGLLPYVYLPIAAARSDAMVWGGLRSPASYWRYLTLRDYARNQTLEFATWTMHMSRWWIWATQRLLLPSFILALGSSVRAPFRIPFGRALFVLVWFGLLAMISFNVVWHLDVPDYNGYVATAYWLAAAGGAAFAASMILERRRIAVAAVALCMSGGWVVAPAPHARTRHIDTLARQLANEVLREAPPRAILITFADYFAGSLFYLQEAEHERTDLVVLAYGLSGSSWHWQHVQQLHPDLKTIDLHAARGRFGRVRAWLDANADRPVLVERLSIASGLGLRACADGLYLRTGASCDRVAAPSGVASQLLGRELARLGDGSPGAAGAIAEVSQHLGEAFWRLGHARAAHDVWLAGAPRDVWPTQLATPSELERAGTWTTAAPAWERGVALGDAARNVYLAGAIAAASGQTKAAMAYLRAAERLGLPEARRALSHLP